MNMKVKQYVIRKKSEMLAFAGQGLKEFYEEQKELGKLTSIAAACRFLDVPRDILAAAIKGDFFDGRCRYVANLQRLYQIHFDKQDHLPEMVIYVEHNCGLSIKFSSKQDDLAAVHVGLKDLCKKLAKAQSPYSKGYREGLAYRSGIDVDTIGNLLSPCFKGFRLTTYLDVLRGQGCMVEFKLFEKMKDPNVCELI